MATILSFQRSAKLRQMTLTGPAATLEPPCDELRDSGAKWAEWMLLAQDGDRDAYHRLLVGIAPYLRAIARRYLGRGEDAEDAVQDILMIVHDIRHTFERGRPFKPWLNTIASRRCIDLLRRRSRRLQNEIATEDDMGEEMDAGPGPDEATARLREAESLHHAVDGLSPRQREAIRLLRLGEMSLEEASEQSRQSVGSLKVACHRALKSLQMVLAQKGQSHD
ncbi:MAG: sigma-70 family RNA polymerase sigma factor [Lysobacter sp.]|nr:sigma-70 family RNA polymerase sigma factor [Lysobacter sp.]